MQLCLRCLHAADHRLDDSDVRRRTYCKNATLASNWVKQPLAGGNSVQCSECRDKAGQTESLPGELFELKRWIFLNWMCFISNQKTQITYRSILLCSYYAWVLSTSAKRFQDKNMDNEAPPAFATCFPSCHRIGHQTYWKAKSNCFNQHRGLIMSYNLYNWWQSL